MGSSPIFRAINFENRPIGRAKDKKRLDMVAVVQLVRTPDCGSGGRVFESRQSPHRQTQQIYFLQKRLFCGLRIVTVNSV